MKLVQKYKLANLFGAKSIVKIDFIVTQHSLVQLLQNYNLHAWNGKNLQYICVC